MTNMQKRKKAKKSTWVPRGQRPPKRRNATEYLHDFIDWLGSRSRQIVLWDAADKSQIFELMGAFERANRMPKVRPGVPKAKIPAFTGHITNEAKVNTEAPLPATPQEALRSIMRILLEMDTTRQDMVLAGALDQLKTIRRQRLDITRKRQLETEIEARTAEDQAQNLERIVRGDVATIYMKTGN